MLRTRAVLAIFAGFALAAIVLPLPPTAANDTSFGASGSPYPRPQPNPDIRLVSETIQARILEQTARVSCVFVLRNEGRAQRVRIGFPEETSGDITEPGLILTFTSSVNGQPVPVRRVVANPVDSGGVFAWWMKDVDFAAGETKTIRNDYEIYISSSVGGFKWFTYILHTGAAWKGPIGEGTITVDLGHLQASDIIGLGRPNPPAAGRDLILRPAGAQIERRVLRWTFANLEPTRAHDIRVAWVELWDAERLCPPCSKRLLAEADLKDKTAQELTLMRNEIYALHGKPFVSKELQDYFSQQPWYLVNPLYHDGLLSSIERANAAFILAYQKKHGLLR